MGMLFNSYVFIFLFLPIVLGGFYILKRLRKYSLAKVFLIGMSLWFYGYFNPWYLFIIIGSVLVNYMFYRLICSSTKKKLFMILGVLFNVCLLFYFKYFNFFIDNLNELFKSSFMVKTILLPLGISFFTFQQISFIVDAYRDSISDYNFIDYALFVTFFPQLIAGPIVSHEEMMPQISSLETKAFDSEQFSRGIMLFIIGLSKKVLIADVFGGAVNWGYTYHTVLTSENILLLMFLYPIQLYFDFSGYCDMAIGLGHMFMIDLPANFDSPYKSQNDIEYWKRWHITLGRFLKKYIYIPLGGSRKGKTRQFINILIVFLVSGFWHGAGWTFVIWGLLHGILQILCYLLMPVLKKIPRAINTFIQFVVTSFLFFFFRSETLEQALSIIKELFSFSHSGISPVMAGFFTRTEFSMAMKILGMDSLGWSGYIMMIFYLTIAFVLIFLCPNSGKISSCPKFKAPSAVILGCLAVWSIISLSEVSTFLYFNF